MKNRRENPKRFRPTVDSVYENAGGGLYRCQYVSSDGSFAWMQNTVSGWSCRCIGIVRYEDGTIEWDYSLHGHFEKLPDPDAIGSQILQRLGSLTNAMLCCAI